MKSKINLPVHRGRSKDGKIAIQIYLTEREVELLDLIAEEECRSRTMQAVWFIKDGIGATARLANLND